MAESFKADCCFKVGRYGSIIHDKIDTVTRKLVKYGDFIDTTVLSYFDSVYYHRDFYSGSLIDNLATCEAFLLRDKNAFFAVDVCNKWYDVYTFDGDCMSYRDLESLDKETGIRYSQMYDLEGYYYVGIELVDVITIQYVPWTYRICLKDGYIYTSKGIFKLPIPVEELSGWRPDMKMYSDIRYQDKYFGYLFTKTGLLLLYLNQDGTLGWEER